MMQQLLANKGIILSAHTVHNYMMITDNVLTIHTVSIRITDIAAPSPGLETISPVYADEMLNESNG